MGSIIVFAIVTLWLIAMIPAVAAPFLSAQSRNSADATPKPTVLPSRTHSGQAKKAEMPSHRPAA